MFLGPLNTEDEGTTIFRNVAVHQSTGRNTPEDLTPQQHRCENLKSRVKPERLQYRLGETILRTSVVFLSPSIQTPEYVSE
jgi:hypothetical protein